MIDALGEQTSQSRHMTSDLVALQDTSGVPPRSKFAPAPMPSSWSANHPRWRRVAWPTWLAVNESIVLTPCLATLRAAPPARSRWRQHTSM